MRHFGPPEGLGFFFCSCGAADYRATKLRRDSFYFHFLRKERRWRTDSRRVAVEGERNVYTRICHCLRRVTYFMSLPKLCPFKSSTFLQLNPQIIKFLSVFFLFYFFICRRFIFLNFFHGLEHLCKASGIIVRHNLYREQRHGCTTVVHNTETRTQPRHRRSFTFQTTPRNLRREPLSQFNSELFKCYIMEKVHCPPATPPHTPHTPPHPPAIT